MRGVQGSGSSRRSPKVSVRSKICGSGDQEQESLFGTPSGNCARSGSLGNSLPQRKLLPGDTNSVGVAAGRLLKSVDPNCPIDQCAHSGSSRTGMYSGRYLRRAATKSISKLPMGSNPITAIYSGDAESEKGASLPTISGELVRAGVLSDSLVYGLRARRQKRKLVNESPRAIRSFLLTSYIGTNSYTNKNRTRSIGRQWNLLTTTMEQAYQICE